MNGVLDGCGRERACTRTRMGGEGQKKSSFAMAFKIYGPHFYDYDALLQSKLYTYIRNAKYPHLGLQRIWTGQAETRPWECAWSETTVYS